MRINVEISGSVGEWSLAEIRAGERAVTQAIGTTARTLKDIMRGQVTSSGLGQRLANTIRDVTYPKGQASLNAAAIVWTKAPKIISAFDKGALIRGRSGNWLAIPTKYAGARGGRGSKQALTPKIFEQRTGLKLRFVSAGNGTGLLVADGARINSKGFAKQSRARGRLAKYKQKSLPVFVLVPQAKLQKRLNLSGAVARATNNLANAIVANWRS